MSFKTKLTEMLGIDYPIIQGGMQWLAKAEFVAAVSEAGCLGFITAASFPSKQELRDEIHKAKELTNKPFGVNVSMLPGLAAGDMTEQYFEVIIDEKIPVVETSGRSPEPFVPPLKEAGIKLIHKVPAVRFAQKAQSVGADAVTIVGFECAGHPGMDDVTTFVLIPRAAETLNIPVIAGGGIANGRTMLAALALGAEGVVMGTRFVATEECVIHNNFKEWLVGAKETDTMMIERSIRNAARVMRNEAAEKVAQMEEQGATLEELMTIISGQVGREAMLSGDLNGGTFAVGQAAGLIHEVKPIKDVVQDIVSEAEEIRKQINAM